MSAWIILTGLAACARRRPITFKTAFGKLEQERLGGRNTARGSAFADGHHLTEDGLIGCFAPAPAGTTGWIAALVDSLDTTERTAMRRALHQVLSSLATSGARRQIGVCQDCTHFGREMCGNLPSTGPSAAECLLLGVPIQPEDVGLLCVHFQPMNEHREDRRTP